MSRFSHRQPVFTWGSVVLLSTLLLAPGVSASVAATLLQALVSGLPHAIAHYDAALTQQMPRRSSEEEESLRAAARDGAAYLVRLDTDPDHPENLTAALAVLMPTRGIIRVLDTGSVPARLAATFCLLPPGESRPGVPPRAPPV